MRKPSPLTAAAAGAVALTLTLAAAGPAAAQSYRDRDDDRGEDVLLGAAVGALAGAVIGNGDARYIAGGAVAGAAVGVAGSGDRDDCGYYRDNRCYRNQGHWEREHGINSNDYGRYGYDRYDRRYDRSRYSTRYVDGRTYADRGYYRDGRFWRNYGQWRSAQNHRRDRDRDYRYDRRW